MAADEPANKAIIQEITFMVSFEYPNKNIQVVY